MHRPPKGWTNQGQARGCLVLHPNSMQAKAQRIEKENQELKGALATLLERVEALESTRKPQKKDKATTTG